MSIQKNKDLKFGSKNEKKVQPILEEHFKLKLQKAKDKYSVYDYFTKDKKIYFELKSRRIYKNQYRDVMVGANKINRGLKLIDEGCDVYICWKFTDKLCYCKIDKDTLKEEWKREGGRWDRGENEVNMMYFIPTINMIDIIDF